MSRLTHDAKNRPERYLKQLIVMKFECGFDNLIQILKRTPNLKSLIISNDGDMIMVDAYQWEHLITSTLPCLNIFKFHFTSIGIVKYNDIFQEKFKQFQSDFWHKQHRWHIEHSVSDFVSSIYTIPYISDAYDLISIANRYCNQFMHDVNVFENVINLTIHPDIITENCQCYFSNIISLTLGQAELFGISFLLKIEQTEYLKMIVNLYNVKYLTISSNCKLETSSTTIITEDSS
jgi:hypothetical protein